MNLVSILLAAILAVWIGMTIRGVIRDKKQGKSLSCGGDCSHCGGVCHWQDAEYEEIG